MSDIPQARGIIDDVRMQLYSADTPLAVSSLELIADRLTEALNLLTRRPYVRKTPAKNHGVTDIQKERIVLLANSTDMSQLEIGMDVGVNPGRVSEVLNGLR